jgi:Melibiase
MIHLEKRMRSWIILCCPALALSTLPSRAAEPSETVLQNEILTIRLDAANGSFTINRAGAELPFIRAGALSAGGGAATTADVTDPIFGQGKALDVSRADGSSDRIMLFPKLPFALFRSTLHNGGKEASVIDRHRPLTFTADLGKPAEDLRLFGTGGLTATSKPVGSYMWQALAEPRSRAGVVAGWLTTERGSGVMLAETVQKAVRFSPQIDYGKLRLQPGQKENLEILAIGHFNDARLGLEAWADAVARVHGVRLPLQPAGYCTWYHARASTEKKLDDQAAVAAKELMPYGFSFMQIDDGWQEGTRSNGPAKNFTRPRANGPYPSGMKAAADALKARGFVAGLWFMPFAGTFDDPWFADHQDWFVKRQDGKPYAVKWGGTSLDMTHPGARAYVRDNVQRMTREWGYRYLKMDGLWTGSATEMAYVNDAYKDDKIGNAVFHDPEKTNIEAFRSGLKLVREAAGPDVFLLGCCAPQNMRSYGGAFGLLDAMRIGPDNNDRWPNLIRGVIYSSRNFHLHRRIWFNDPDPVYVRQTVSLELARLLCSWAAVSGQLTVASDAFADLPAERLDMLRRIMPAHDLRPRPVDLFEQAIPRIWLLTDDRRSPRHDVIGLFNWGKEPVAFDEPLERIGLSSKGEYAAFDFWENTLLPPFRERLRLTLQPAVAGAPETASGKKCCAVLAVRLLGEHPQLLSTSRHVTQGVIEVTAESWDAKTNELSGRSKVVGGDDYELRVLTCSNRGEWKSAAVDLSEADRKAGVTISSKEEAGLLRIAIRTPQSRDVQWQARFDGKPKKE